ncbi:meiosis-specific with OB domain-containing protein isoform X3 [Poecilia formosa]|uniref:meiosis-specific with OB domain-containing protein isoform X3 n=1 Tax=Poecilia formosa TaxID=48698 RepID=UPI0007BAB42B|nr:PREDICTED: meiosis-specific with OB domain-containing protein isoform X3 [Poecilia formosa]
MMLLFPTTLKAASVFSRVRRYLQRREKSNKTFRDKTTWAGERQRFIIHGAHQMASQSYISISELHPNLSHAKVFGVIIGKTDVRSFPDRKNIEIERFTFGFTIRDSAEFFINVSAWGGEAFISGLADSFSIGDCVIIENPLVSTKDPEKGDKFCPATPSHYRLLLTETHSQVSVCGDGVERLLPLLHLPVKDSRDFYSLADIVANGQQLDGAVINVLAAVKLIGETKQFVTSDGRRGQRLELKLFDDSVSSFPLISWDREAIQLLQNLVPRETVLFVADTKMSFDSFRGSMVATVSSKTIITVNPDTREASLLFSYVKDLSESGALDQDEALEDPPDGRVCQFDRRSADGAKVEVSAGTVQNIPEDPPLCQDEERDEGDDPGLFAGRPRRGEAEHVCPAAGAVMQPQLTNSQIIFI